MTLCPLYLSGTLTRLLHAAHPPQFLFVVRPKPFHATLSGGVVNGVEQVHYLVCGTLYFPFDPTLVKNQQLIFRQVEYQDIL